LARGMLVLVSLVGSVWFEKPEELDGMAHRSGRDAVRGSW
jgi:hypothetical protein